MVIINFNDGSYLEIHSDTVLNGYKNSSDDEKEFYLRNIFTDSIDGKFSKDGSKLSTGNPKIGILGFLLSVDCFSVGVDTESNVVYFSSAVKSVENSAARVGMEPGIKGIPFKR
jgi:hypothetical protein